MDTRDALARLQQWYADHCNDDWEHAWGINIETLDNPGWSIRIDLQETELSTALFEAVKIDYDHPSDWLFCEVKEGQFIGRSGPKKLEAMVGIFLEWAARIAQGGK